LTGSIPNIVLNPLLVEFNCHSNQLTGPVPSSVGIIGFTNYFCYNNQLTGSIPILNNNIQRFDCNSNQLSGSIPNLNNNVLLRIYACQDNQLTGSIPSLNNNTLLQDFRCQTNQLTGLIPSLSANTSLEIFFCLNNQLTGFVGGSVSINLGNFQTQNNQLTTSAVDAILAAFVAANKTTGTRTLNLGGTNASPTGGVNNPDKLTLESRGWLVTVTP
jgi:hypothetical protein